VTAGQEAVSFNGAPVARQVLQRMGAALATRHTFRKPPYYWHDERRFAFGSEVKVLLAAGISAEMDETPLKATARGWGRRKPPPEGATDG